MIDRMIEIPWSRWVDLVRDQEILQALNAGGVANWEGYVQALDKAGLITRRKAELSSFDGWQY